MVKNRKLTNLATGTLSVLLMQLVAASALPQQWSSGNRVLSSISSPAQALDTVIRYTPPNRGTPRSTQGTGSRGCPDGKPVGLSLLVPKDHTGLTVSGRPTFFWNISEVPTASLEFALVQPGVAKPLFVKQVKADKAGVVKVELPADMPELVPGQKYQWSVSLVCNQQRRSGDVFAQAAIERAPISPEMAAKLAGAKTDQERAGLYAQGGYWFDALTLLYKNYTISKDNADREAMVSLLEQGGLTEEAQQVRERLAVR